MPKRTSPDFSVPAFKFALNRESLLCTLPADVRGKIVCLLDPQDADSALQFESMTNCPAGFYQEWFKRHSLRKWRHAIMAWPKSHRAITAIIMQCAPPLMPHPGWLRLATAFTDTGLDGFMQEMGAVWVLPNGRKTTRHPMLGTLALIGRLKSCGDLSVCTWANERSDAVAIELSRVDYPEGLRHWPDRQAAMDALFHVIGHIPLMHVDRTFYAAAKLPKIDTGAVQAANVAPQLPQSSAFYVPFLDK